MLMGSIETMNCIKLHVQRLSCSSTQFISLDSSLVVYLIAGEEERDRCTEREAIHSLIFPSSTGWRWARSQSWKPRTQSMSSKWWQDPNYLSRHHSQGLQWWKSEPHQRFKPIYSSIGYDALTARLKAVAFSTFCSYHRSKA